MLRKVSRFSAAALLLIAPSSVQAASLLPNCNPVPGNYLPPRLQACGIDDLFQLLINIYNFLLGLAGLVLILYLIWGGLRMLIFYMSESPEKDLEAAKYTILRAISGFIIIILAYLLVNSVLLLLGFNTDSEFGILLGKYFTVTKPSP